VPANGYREETFVPLKVRIPRTKGAWFWKKVVYDEVDDQIYVQRKAPFACAVTKYLPNPQFMPEVAASREHEEWAATEGGRGRPSNNGSLSAEVLLVNTVPNAPALYRTKEAKILAPNCRTWGNGPCEHGNPSATFTFTADVVNYALSAPSKEPHWHSTQSCGWWGCIPGGYLHGGGGSHAHVACAPRFVVPRIGVPEQIMGEQTSASLARRDQKSIPIALPDANWSVQVSCDFRDGDRSFKTPLLTVTPTNRSVTVSPVHAEVNAAGLLIIETQYAQTFLARQ
jgi:hypothetical protein